MIQFNLLPDIKIQYLRAKRQEHAVVLGAIVAIIASLAIFVLLLAVVHGLQKKNISDLSEDITRASTELQDTKDLNKILTIQNQLTSLPGLHDQKAVTSRAFEYLTQLTPTEATISNLQLDVTQTTMAITGNAPSLALVNQYVDTLKFTNFSTEDDDSDKPAFSEVVLSSFSRSANDATYTVSMKFDPLIFNVTQDVALTVPNIITTRSEVDKPTELFQEGTE